MKDDGKYERGNSIETRLIQSDIHTGDITSSKFVSEGKQNRNQLIRISDAEKSTMIKQFPKISESSVSQSQISETYDDFTI